MSLRQLHMHRMCNAGQAHSPKVRSQYILGQYAELLTISFFLDSHAHNHHTATESASHETAGGVQENFRLCCATRARHYRRATRTYAPSWAKATEERGYNRRHLHQHFRPQAVQKYHTEITQEVRKLLASLAASPAKFLKHYR